MDTDSIKHKYTLQVCSNFSNFRLCSQEENYFFHLCMYMYSICIWINNLKIIMIMDISQKKSAQYKL